MTPLYSGQARYTSVWLRTTLCGNDGESSTCPSGSAVSTQAASSSSPSSKLWHPSHQQHHHHHHHHPIFLRQHRHTGDGFTFVRDLRSPVAVAQLARAALDGEGQLVLQVLDLAAHLGGVLLEAAPPVLLLPVILLIGNSVALRTCEGQPMISTCILNCPQKFSSKKKKIKNVENFWDFVELICSRACMCVWERKVQMSTGWVLLGVYLGCCFTGRVGAVITSTGEQGNAGILGRQRVSCHRPHPQTISP